MTSCIRTLNCKITGDSTKKLRFSGISLVAAKLKQFASVMIKDGEEIISHFMTFNCIDIGRKSGAEKK